MAILNEFNMITQERLKELLHYDPNTGVFTNIIERPLNPKGSATGNIYTYNGKYYYRLIGLDGEIYKAANLAWLYMKGYYPSNLIDHKDLDSLNDRFENLREATISQNSCNRLTRIDSTSRIKGLYFNSKYKRYEVSINFEGKRYNTTFGKEQKGEAIKWLQETRVKLHGEFANHG